jgi:hypothetical protein
MRSTNLCVLCLSFTMNMSLKIHSNLAKVKKCTCDVIFVTNTSTRTKLLWTHYLVQKWIWVHLDIFVTFSCQLKHFGPYFGLTHGFYAHSIGLYD